MRVLGIGAEGDSGAAVVEGGRILAALNEERLCRLKLVEGFPRGAIHEVLRLSGTDVDRLDAVLVATTDDRFANELEPFVGWFDRWHRNGAGGLIKRVAGRVSRHRNRLPFLETGYYWLQTPTFRHRRKAIRAVLREEFGVRCPVVFVDHHLAHVASAYLTSGFGDALVVSLDGGGDGRSGLLYAVRNGRFEYLHETSAFNSLGNYYAYVTHLCGFQAMKHEGKITGLAAYGEPRYAPMLREFVDETDGTVRNLGGVVFQEAIRQLERRLPKGWVREDLAASIQVHFEDVARRVIRYWSEQTGLRDVALAGGVFANVRVNQEVFELPSVDRVFVHPGMTDGGLAVGAALAACVPGILNEPMVSSPDPLGDVYLGPDLTERQIEAAMRRAGLSPMRLNGALGDTIAELLADGRVVARVAGRMEYGPRALGNRSILYQPTDPSVNDWLNQNLQRTEFMPFAPSILWEERHRCFTGVDGAEHPAQFMTITFDCTPWMRERMAGVVHLDGTARPHLVRRESNPGYYRILEAYQEKTGLPGIINTSFNMHEEPIVCSADDSIRAFLTGRLDFLAIGAHLLRHPELESVAIHEGGGMENRA
jgi:carbamoyltransferase